MEKLIKALPNGQWTMDETLEKAVKKNALQRLARDLAPHVKSVSVHHLDNDLNHSSTPHPDGLVGFDIQHHPDDAEAVNRVLGAHGHFNHQGAFGERGDGGDDSDIEHHYGALKLHPEHAKNLIPSGGFSGTKPEDAVIAPVQDVAIGSQNHYEGSRTGEGNTQPARWQGSDPRHTENEKGPHDYYDPDKRGFTRAGQKIAQIQDGVFSNSKPAERSLRSVTSGISNRGYDRVETGKPVKLSKNDQKPTPPKKPSKPKLPAPGEAIDPMDHPSSISERDAIKMVKQEQEVLKFEKNGQWSLKSLHKSEDEHESVGNIDFGNNQTHEIMRHKKTGKIGLSSHQDSDVDKPAPIIPVKHFMQKLKAEQPHHVAEVNKQLRAQVPLKKNSED